MTNIINVKKKRITSRNRRQKLVNKLVSEISTTVNPNNHIFFSNDKCSITKVLKDFSKSFEKLLNSSALNQVERLINQYHMRALRESYKKNDLKSIKSKQQIIDKLITKILVNVNANNQVFYSNEKLKIAKVLNCFNNDFDQLFHISAFNQIDHIIIPDETSYFLNSTDSNKGTVAL